MLQRHLRKAILRSSRTFPVVAILGPRQSGKTTLAKSCFPQKKYVSLENVDERQFAESDPRGFLSRFPDGAILDEIQRVPHLFSYLQTMVDEKSKRSFIITGSQNYLLMEKITQSLAGRVCLHTLLPLSQEEWGAKLGKSLYTQLWRGSYPRLAASRVDPAEWHRNYIATYVERDVRELKNVTDLSAFSIFLKICAARAGQLLNLSSLGDDCGVSHNTAKAWLSVLETSYIVFLLRPYFRNFNKRMIKSPKIYFYDTGLLCHLLGIHEAGMIPAHPLKGGIFESYLLSEFFKRKFNRQSSASFYFWQDSAHHEIDCLIDTGKNILPVEIKSGETFSPDYTKNFIYWQKNSKSSEKPIVVYGGADSMERQGAHLVSWRDLAQIRF